MRKILILIFVLLSSVMFSQTNATFNNLDVRNRTTLRGYNYIYDSTFFKPDGSNIPWWDVSDTLGFVLSISNPNESQLVKVSLVTLLDSLGITGGADSLYITYGCYDNIDTWLYNSDTIYIDTCQLWYLDGDTIINVNDYKVRMTDEVYIYPLPPEATKTGRMMHINQYGQIEWMSPSTLVDTLVILMPNYWTFVDSATDTLKNNVSNTDGIIFLDSASLELPPTTATVGQVKQNGVRLLHTYHEKGDNNLFIGQGAGNFTADSSFNIGIGKGAMSSLAALGNNNVAVGYNAFNKITDGAENVAIGALAGENLTTSSTAIAIGYKALNAATTSISQSVAIGAGSLQLFTNGYATAVGYNTLTTQTNGGANNTAIGWSVLDANTTGDDNTGVGHAVFTNNLTGSYNTSVGSSALTTLYSGTDNTAVGYNALKNTWSSTNYNTAVGSRSLYSNSGNSGSTAVGYKAMYYADDRASGRTTYNTAVGYEAMRGTTTAANNTGQYSTAVGYQALDGMSSGSFNTVYGYDAGGGITTGDSNILIGTSAGSQLTTESDRLFIDNTNTTTPLIWGNMRSDSLRWNADVAFAKDLWYEDTYWRDATTSATALAPGVNAPSQRTIVGGILGMGYAPSVQNDISYGQVQLNHDYKFDTDLEAHMHFMIEEAGEAGDTAVFALEYSWADIDETFPTSDTLTVLIPCAAITAKQHKLVEFGAITTPGGNNVSSSIIFRLERLQDSPHDTYDGANEYVIVLDVDYHLEIDAPGSRQEYYK